MHYLTDEAHSASLHQPYAQYSLHFQRAPNSYVIKHSINSYNRYKYTPKNTHTFPLTVRLSLDHFVSTDWFILRIIIIMFSPQ